MKSGRYDAVVGLGGGKIIDCAKYAAARVGLPLVAVATNLSHDGLCSPVATLDNDAGRGSYGVPNPIAIVIDLDVIREAPVRFVRSGIGDAISNISAVADWELAHAVRRRGRSTAWPPPWRARPARPCCATPAASATTTSSQVLAEAPGAHRHLHVGRRGQPARLRRLPRDQPRLRPALPQARRQPRRAVRPRRRLRHATCAGDREMAGLMAEVLRRHGLPVLPAEIGFSADEFVEAVEYAPQTRPGRYTILEHLDLSTDQIRDAYADYAKTIGS